MSSIIRSVFVNKCVLYFCRENVEKFQNPDLCKLTEQVIFTDPYYGAPVNRHTSPQLDAWADFMKHNQEAKIAANRLKVIL